MFEDLNHLIPELCDPICKASKSKSTSTLGRARIFIRLSVNRNVFGSVIKIFQDQPELSKLHYSENGSILGSPEELSGFLCIIQDLVLFTFNFDPTPPNIEKEDYWENILNTAKTKRATSSEKKESHQNTQPVDSPVTPQNTPIIHSASHSDRSLNLDDLKQRLRKQSVMEIKEEVSLLKLQLDSIRKEKAALKSMLKTSASYEDFTKNLAISPNNNVSKSQGNSAESDSGEEHSGSMSTDKKPIVLPGATGIVYDKKAIKNIAIPVCRPKWKPDNAVTDCDSCHKAFTIRRRRHHCRSCGGIFCKACLKRQPLPHLDFRYPVKVCVGCLLNLMAKNNKLA
eukprot:TRINITY_DN11188_c0_g1_i2.p1 TRINITY_DN11188_c0_g1~~TRINITY_DN11188_c0_g1_i2.p1  ORF type:complete len:358 (+),score=49.50 TRINITY_DN11188_c0_g1_i2:54-1076(+)